MLLLNHTSHGWMMIMSPGKANEYWLNFTFCAQKVLWMRLLSLWLYGDALEVNYHLYLNLPLKAAPVPLPSIVSSRCLSPCIDFYLSHAPLERHLKVWNLIRFSCYKLDLTLNWTSRLIWILRTQPEYALGFRMFQLSPWSWKPI